MNFGYKTFIALTLATAACFRTKAQNSDADNTNNFAETITDYDPTLNEDSTITLDEAQQQELASQPVESGDSTALEKIYQSMQDIEHDVVRFIAHFESIKMNAYWDKKAQKWTIGFGNTTHPDGRPIKAGDRIKDEAELMHYFRSYFKDRVAPAIRDYLPGWEKLERHEKIAVLDLFWNAGSGQGVLFNKKEYNAGFQQLNEKQREEVAEQIANQNQEITYNGRNYSMRDLPEWRYMNMDLRTQLMDVYPNLNIAKGDFTNSAYNEKFQRLNENQRMEVIDGLHMLNDGALKPMSPTLGMGSMLQNSASNYRLTVPSLKYQQVNDSTIRYTGFVITDDYHLSDVPQWYQTSAKDQLNISRLLAQRNRGIVYNGRRYEANDIPSLYFLNKTDRDSVQTLFADNQEVLVRKPGDKKNQTVLSNLGYELNAYAATGSQEAKERVAVRIASFIRSRGNVVSALQKRANIRAQVFMGEIQLGGDGPNSIDLDKVNIGAGYSVKIADLTSPELICDSINNCSYGRNFSDTLQYETTRPTRTPQNVSRSRASRRMPQGRTMVRTGSRGR